MHIMEVYQSLEAYNNKKHGIWITKKMIFFPEKVKATNTVIEWSFNLQLQSLESTCTKWGLGEIFSLSKLWEFFVCDYYEQGTEHCSLIQDI